MVLISYSSGSTTFTNATWQAAGSPTVVELGTGWTAIGEEAFQYQAITSVEIPASVTSIGDRAFNMCENLTTVTFIPSAVWNTTGITSMGSNVFSNATLLATVRIKDGQVINGTVYNISTTGSFFGSPTTTTLDNIYYIIPYTSGSTTFTYGEWYSRGRPRFLELGEGWQHIYPNSFNGRIDSIHIPASVISIMDQAFINNGFALSSISFAAGSGLTTIGSGAFAWTELTSIAIPASVTYIENGAFADTYLATVLINDGQVINGTTYNVGDTGSFFGSPSWTILGNIYPDILTSLAVNANNTSTTITFNRPVYKSDRTTRLTATELVPSIASGTATLSSYTVSTTDDTTFTFALTLSGTSDGSEVLTLTGTVYDSGAAYNTAYNTAISTTVSFNDLTAPTISTALAVGADNTSATITFSEPVYKSDGTTRLTATELVPTIASGTATLSSYTVSTTDDTTFTFALTLSGTSDGSEVLTLTGTVYDSGSANNTAISTTVSFNDLAPATLSSVSLVSDYTDTTKAGIGSKITLAFTASEQIQTPIVAFNVGNTAVTGSITITNTGGNDWSAVYYIGSTHPSGALTYTIDHTDMVGNQGTQVTSGSGSVTVDTVRPTFTSISIASNNSTTSLSKPGNDVTLTMTASETIQSPTVVFTSGSIAVDDTTPTIANTSGDTWTATYTTNIADTDGSVAFTITYIDIYGNAASAVATAVTDGSSVTFDKTLPTVSSFVMDDVALKNGDTATVSLTFSEAVPGFDSDSYVTVANGTMTTMTSNAQNIVWTAVFTPTTALEAVTNVLTLTSGYTDTSGNVSTHADIQSANYAIDTIQPVTASVTPITFNGTTTVIDRTPSFVFSSTQGGTITTSNATFSSTTNAVSGNNTITFDQLADYTTHDAITIIVTDPAGNPSTALTVPSFTVDTTTSTLDVITTVSNDATFTNTLNTIGANHTDKTVELHATTNPHASYKARITLPNGDFTALTEANKNTIKSTVRDLYATELNIVASDTIFVDILEGSIIIDVYVMTTAAVNSNIQICFPKGTPVTTNQGEMSIEDIIPGVHTIRGRKITAITCTQSNTSDIVLIKKHALGKNVPCASTQISNHHRVFYKGKMVKASDLVNMCEGVIKTPYNGETLYNVVMRKHDKMMVNNLICETLHPDNVMARICAGDYTHREKVELCNMLKRIGKTNDYNAYNKFYASLK